MKIEKPKPIPEFDVCPSSYCRENRDLLIKLIDEHNKEEWKCPNAQPQKCDHEWKIHLSFPAGLNTTAMRNKEYCNKCGKLRLTQTDAGEPTKILDIETQPKKWKPEDMILRLQHILTGIGFGCKCSGFQNCPNCPIHYTEGVSKSEEDIIKEYLRIIK